MKALLGRVLNEERAQDAFEYLLVIGAISTAVIIAITTVGFATMADGVIDGVCGAIDLLPNMPAITCT
jgi:Flp pilus assembly pilin Flp